MRRRTRMLWVALAAVPGLYLLAALIGSLIPVNREWQEPQQGVTIYIADNGIHSDLILPVEAEGLDWAALIPKGHFRNADPEARWIAFGSGEERVYLDTPRWQDIRLRTIWAALTGGRRLMHVEYVDDPSYARRELRLRPEEYRRLWTALRSDFTLDGSSRPINVTGSGYWGRDTFYRATGKASALRTCNSWTADRLRLAGVKTSLWPPFAQGLLWRYREARDPPQQLLGRGTAVGGGGVLQHRIQEPLHQLRWSSSRRTRGEDA